MEFFSSLIHGTLIKRYKRFLADVVLDDGTTITAHCPNSGSMMGLKAEGASVWLSTSNNPKRKLAYTWELADTGSSLVGIHSSDANAIVAEALEKRAITELSDYANIKREVYLTHSEQAVSKQSEVHSGGGFGDKTPNQIRKKHGEKSRIDFLLSSPNTPDCFVEVKSITLSRTEGLAEFPDAVTARGTKHLHELMHMAEAGKRAVILFVVQREDCHHFSIADDIDPIYAETFCNAVKNGVEALCYSCRITTERITLNKKLTIDV